MPPNPAYRDHRLGYRNYLSELGKTITAMGAEFYDLSTALSGERGIHSDLIHLNSAGQAMFTELLVDHVIAP